MKEDVIAIMYNKLVEMSEVEWDNVQVDETLTDYGNFCDVMCSIAKMLLSQDTK